MFLSIAVVLIPISAANSLLDIDGFSRIKLRTLRWVSANPSTNLLPTCSVNPRTPPGSTLATICALKVTVRKPLCSRNVGVAAPCFLHNAMTRLVPRPQTSVERVWPSPVHCFTVPFATKPNQTESFCNVGGGFVVCPGWFVPKCLP